MMRAAGYRSGFTLLELTLAMAMTAMLALSLYAALHVALRAKRVAAANMDAPRSAAVAMNLLSQDFESVLPPTGVLAGAFTAIHQPGPTGDADTIEFYSVGADRGTNTDPLSEGIRKIDLVLRTDVTPPVLVRQITRNLLATSQPPTDEEVLCRNVRSISLRYFDGTVWQTDWDSTSLGDVLPSAISLTVQIQPPPRPNQPDPQPITVTRVIPLACSKPADSTTSGSTP
jgi:type II secretion system protein J